MVEVTSEGWGRAHAPRHAAGLIRTQCLLRHHRLWKSKHSTWFCRWRENPRGDACCARLLLFLPSRWMRCYKVLGSPNIHCCQCPGSWLTLTDSWCSFGFWCAFIYLFIYLFAFRRMTVWVYSLFSHYASVMFPAHTSSFMAVAWGIPLQSRQYDSGEFLRLSFGFVFSNSYKKEFHFFLSLSQFNFDLNTFQVQWLRLLKYISAKTKK